MGTIPAATAAAAPPLEPPAVQRRSAHPSKPDAVSYEYRASEPPLHRRVGGRFRLHQIGLNGQFCRLNFSYIFFIPSFLAFSLLGEFSLK